MKEPSSFDSCFGVFSLKAPHTIHDIF
jgi:hypothetical protein